MKLATAQYIQTPTVDIDSMIRGSKKRDNTFHAVLEKCRHFYENDPIAGSVITRMADMAVTQLKSRKMKNKRINAFYKALSVSLMETLKIAALEFMISGLVVFDDLFVETDGKSIGKDIGNRSYFFPEDTWVRDPMVLELKKLPVGKKRKVFYKVSAEEVYFLQNEGKYIDGTVDTALYQQYLEMFPLHVAKVRAGSTKLELSDAFYVCRKMTSYNVYPRPFLQNALTALEHKEYLKRLDRALAQKAIDAMRHVTVGNDQFPATDEDIADVTAKLTTASQYGDGVYNFVTNHVTSIAWVIPPMEAILSDSKYIEPNADIFIAVGFPRILSVGETSRSNGGSSSIALLGPVATLNDIREALLRWVKHIFKKAAELNGFSEYPDPYFTAIALQDITALTQFAVNAMQSGAISKDTVAQLYGTSYEDESDKIIEEGNGNTNPAQTNPSEQRISPEETTV